MRILIGVLFVFVAIVNLLPGLGVLSAQRLEGFYGVALQDPNLVVLMRHRAVTLAIVGGLLAVAAFQPALRGEASVAGFVSMLSFIALAAGSSSPELRRVLIVDVIATLALIAAVIFDRVRKAPVF
jgi:hypothetical protein